MLHRDMLRSARHVRAKRTIVAGTRRGAVREPAGRLPFNVLFLILGFALGLGIENERPSLLHDVHANRQVITTERCGRLVVVTISEGSLYADLVEGDGATLSLGMILKHARRDAAKAENLDGLGR